VTVDVIALAILS